MVKVSCDVGSYKSELKTERRCAVDICWIVTCDR